MADHSQHQSQGTAASTAVVSKKETTEKDSEFISKAMIRYRTSVDGSRHLFDDAIQDLEFVYNVEEAQWPESVKKERKDRPRITVNKLKKFVNQLVGEQRQNRANVKVRPEGDGATKEMAEHFNDIIRGIEYDSTADVAYDTGYKYAVTSGFGFWRIITEYIENSFDQRILIKRIYNPFTVHFDEAAKEFDYSDARFCFIEESLPLEDFKNKYPDAAPVNFTNNERGAEYRDWFDRDRVRIAEYFYKVQKSRKLALLDNGETVDITTDLAREQIEKSKLTIEKTREETYDEVMWAKISGAEILEGTRKWAGKYIPVVPVLGDEIYVRGKKYYYSLIRDAKDPQRMYNYWRTTATELVALAPKAPFLLTPEQVSNHEASWREANVKNWPYLLYNHVPGLEKPQRERQTEIPMAVINEAQIASRDIDDVIGKYEASQGKGGNERSAKAIQARQAVSNVGTFTYIDNMKRAIVYTGKILLDLIPKVIDTERTLNTRKENGDENTLTVNKQMPDESVVNDLKKGSYGVVADVGTYSTKRQESVNGLIQFLQYSKDPRVHAVIAPLVLANMDVPGASEAAEQLKSIPPQEDGGATNTPTT